MNKDNRNKKEIKQETNYLKKKYGKLINDNILLFYSCHSNTARLFEQEKNIVLIDIIHNYKDKLNIYNYDYDYPYQYNQHLFNEFSKLNILDDYNIYLILQILDALKLDECLKGTYLFYEVQKLIKENLLKNLNN